MEEHIKLDKSQKIGYIADCYVMLELARRNIYSQKLFSYFDYDLLAENDIRIEVKSSNISIIRDKRCKTERKVWSFNNYEVVKFIDRVKRISRGRDRRCDFFVFVGFGENYIPKKFFVVPKEVVGNRIAVTIPVNRVSVKKSTDVCFEQYDGRWDLIVNKVSGKGGTKS